MKSVVKLDRSEFVNLTGICNKYGSMEIRGILGNLVESKITDKGYNLITLDVVNYVNGIYFITLKDAIGKTVASQKISIQH
jgi:hypothetical protein